MSKTSNSLTELLLAWYIKNARALPWRTNYEPYHVLVSEFMLQQTQMERGVAYFNAWMQKFPTIQDLAQASTEEVLRSWEGLGYYRRAHYLHDIAKKVCDEHKGIIPKDKEILKTFKGLGDYTLAALCGIAYNQDIVTIDANVERVYSRLFCIEGEVKKKPAKEQIQHYAYAHLPSNNARQYNQALMELGALICKKKPLCSLCPLSEICKAKSSATQENYPSPIQKQKKIYEDWLQLIICTSDNKILINQREKSKHWGGLFEFLPLEAKNKEHNSIISNYLDNLELVTIKIEQKCTLAYTYTNHKNNVTFYKIYTRATSEELLINQHFANYIALNVHELKHYAFPSPYRKGIDKIFHS